MNITGHHDETRSDCVEEILKKIKSQGFFDKFRKECLADIDTKPSYRNLQQRVEKYVSRFLLRQTWSPQMNKNQMRDGLRKHINQSALLISGVERIVEQTIKPRILTTIKPKIDEIVCNFLGIDPVERQKRLDKKYEQERKHHMTEPMYTEPQASHIGSTNMDPAASGAVDFAHTWPQYPSYPPSENQFLTPDYTNRSMHPHYIHQWAGRIPYMDPSHVNVPAAPGTEDNLVSDVHTLRENNEPQDMDICEDFPEPPPLPPEPEPPPDDLDDIKPPAPPEPPDDSTSSEFGASTSLQPPLPNESEFQISFSDGEVMIGGDVTTGEVTEEIVNMDIPSDDIRCDQQLIYEEPFQVSEVGRDDDGNEVKYHFDWSQDIDIEAVSDVESLSSVHTSDLSSFSDEISASDSELPFVGAQGREDSSEYVGERLDEELVMTKSRAPHPLISLQYNFSDDDDETRDQRKERIAREKEMRYTKRLQRRAELEQKKKERGEEKERQKNSDNTNALSTRDQTSKEPKAALPKLSPQKKHKSKAQLKEELMEQKVNERRLRQRRTRNRRYTSSEFTSIFTEGKRPFASRSYETIDVEKFPDDSIIIYEQSTDPRDTEDFVLDDQEVEETGILVENVNVSLRDEEVELSDENVEVCTEDDKIIHSDDVSSHRTRDAAYEVSNVPREPQSATELQDREVLSCQLQMTMDNVKASDNQPSTLTPKDKSISPVSERSDKDLSLRPGSPFSDVSDISRNDLPPVDVASKANLQNDHPARASNKNDRGGNSHTLPAETHEDNLGKTQTGNLRSSTITNSPLDDVELPDPGSTKIQSKDKDQESVDTSNNSPDTRRSRSRYQSSLSRSPSRSSSGSRIQSSSSKRHHRKRTKRSKHKRHSKHSPRRWNDVDEPPRQSLYHNWYNQDDPGPHEIILDSWERHPYSPERSCSRTGSDTSEGSVQRAARRTDYHRRTGKSKDRVSPKKSTRNENESSKSSRSELQEKSDDEPREADHYSRSPRWSIEDSDDGKRLSRRRKSHRRRRRTSQSPDHYRPSRHSPPSDRLHHNRSPPHHYATSPPAVMPMARMPGMPFHPGPPPNFIRGRGRPPMPHLPYPLPSHAYPPYPMYPLMPPFEPGMHPPPPHMPHPPDYSYGMRQNDGDHGPPSKRMRRM